MCLKWPVTHVAQQSGVEKCRVSLLCLPQLAPEGQTLMAFNTATFPTSCCFCFYPQNSPVDKLPCEARAPHKTEPTARTGASSEAAVTALNESSGLCRTRAGWSNVFIKEKTSSPLNKERNYKHTTTGPSVRNLRAERDPVASGSYWRQQNKWQFRRACSNTLSAQLAPLKFKLHYGGIMEGVGDKWRLFWFWQQFSLPEKTPMWFFFVRPRSSPHYCSYLCVLFRQQLDIWKLNQIWNLGNNPL